MSGNARQFLGYDDERTTGAALSLLRDTEVGKMATIPLLVDGEAEEGGSVEGTEGAGPRGYTFLLSAISSLFFLSWGRLGRRRMALGTTAGRLAIIPRPPMPTSFFWDMPQTASDLF